MSDDITTVYGKVNRDRLEELQQSFDTSKLLEAVEFIDQVRRRIWNSSCPAMPNNSTTWPT